MIGLENYCLACDRQLVPSIGPEYVRERGPVLRLPVALGLLWLAGAAAALGVAAWAVA